MAICELNDPLVWRLPERRCFPQLLGNSGIRRRPRHANVDDAPRAEFRDEERKQRLEEQIMDLEEVASPNILGMVPKEGWPALTVGSWRPCLAPGALHGPRGDRDANLQQFAPNPFHAPQSIVRSHLLDQGDHPRGKPRRA